MTRFITAVSVVVLFAGIISGSARKGPQTLDELRHFCITRPTAAAYEIIGLRQQASGVKTPEEKPKEIDLTGYYSCTTTYEITQKDKDDGKEPNDPSSTVVVIKRGYDDQYFLTWVTTPPQHGAGQQSGSTLRVGFSLGTNIPGISTYTVTNLNPLTLEGKWTVQPNGGKGTEKLVFLKALK